MFSTAGGFSIRTEAVPATWKLFQLHFQGRVRDISQGKSAQAGHLAEERLWL